MTCHKGVISVSNRRSSSSIDIEICTESDRVAKVLVSTEHQVDVDGQFKVRSTSLTAPDTVIEVAVATIFDQFLCYSKDWVLSH